jgi:hypothetical protein
VVEERVVGREADLARHSESLGDPDPALEVHAGIGLDGVHPVEGFEEVEMPE